MNKKKLAIGLAICIMAISAYVVLGNQKVNPAQVDVNLTTDEQMYVNDNNLGMCFYGTPQELASIDPRYKIVNTGSS